MHVPMLAGKAIILGRHLCRGNREWQYGATHSFIFQWVDTVVFEQLSHGRESLGQFASPYHVETHVISGVPSLDPVMFHCAFIPG